ncbi:hypothetical protein B0H19DRAFT_1175580 [Mycena capillaripes]|nr:hypothetical protein B0H19DRAFT_1175580 [Mycena capillaripes]
MQTFTFDSERILKSTIRDDRSTRYTTNTVKQTLLRHTTTLEDSSGGACATINWRDRTFEIGGRTDSIDQLKRKVSNFSLTRYWRWSDGEEYKVKYSEADNKWTVTVDTGEVVAEFASSILRTFKPSSLPVWRIARVIGDEDERHFLLLLLLYSETRRLDRQD